MIKLWNTMIVIQMGKVDMGKNGVKTIKSLLVKYHIYLTNKQSRGSVEYKLYLWKTNNSNNNNDNYR